MLALTNGLTLTLTKSLPRLLGSFLFSSSPASCQPLPILRFCDAVVPHRVCLRRLTYWRMVMAIPPSKGQWLRVGISQPVSDLRFCVAICCKTLGVTSVTFLNGSPPWHIYKIKVY